MRSRAALAALTKDVATLRERVASADLGPVPTFVTQADGTFVSDDPAYDAYATLDDALAVVPDRGAYIARAVVIDMSAGEGHLDPITGQVIGDGYDDDDDVVCVPVVRPPRRVDWADVYPLPNVKPGRDDMTGRAWYDRLPDGRQVFGQTGDGDLVTVDALGPVVVETEP